MTVRLTGFASDFTAGDVRGEDINDANYSVLERQAHWQAGLDMLRDEIGLGVGFGNYGDAYAKYALINWPDALGHAHNYYINLLAEVGIIGFAALFVFLGGCFLANHSTAALSGMAGSGHCIGTCWLFGLPWRPIIWWISSTLITSTSIWVSC